MNPNETHEVTEVIGRLRDELGLAILVIEHDMHVVEGISDRVVALDHGVKIAEGSFDAGRQPPGRRRGVPGPRPGGAGRGLSSLLELDNVTTYYGQMRILEGIALDGRRRRARVPARRQRVGQVDHAEDDPRDRPAARRDACCSTARTCTRWPVPQRIASGLAIVPENRRLFGQMTVRENLELGAVLQDGADVRRGPRARPHAVPAPAGAPGPARGNAVGRRAADGRDGPGADVAAAAAADGRAVDGALAGARPAELPDHQGGPRVGRGGPDGRAERDHGAVDRRPRATCSSTGDDRARRARHPSCCTTRTSSGPTSAASHTYPHTYSHICMRIGG